MGRVGLRDARGGKPTKVPRLPSLEKKGNASSSDPTTWGTVRAACDAAQVHGYAGVGFVFAEGGGVVGVDLDGDLLTIWAEHPRLASPVTARTLLAVARELANRDDSDLIDALVGVARVPQEKLTAENVGYSIRGAKRRVRELEDGARVRIAPAGKGRSGQRWTVERVS